MKDKFFLDSNIVIYSLSEDNIKKGISKDLIKENPIISTQVITETINIFLKKLKLSKQESFNIAEFIINNSILKLINYKTIRLSFDICLRYNYSYYDSLIIASALENDCLILYSEDLQHNQLIEEKLTIINPFLKND